MGSDLTVCPIGFCNSTMVKEGQCTEDTYALLFKALTFKDLCTQGQTWKGGSEKAARREPEGRTRLPGEGMASPVRTRSSNW